MATTIQISEETVHILKNLRDQFKLPSYDALVRFLINKKVKKSLWGAGGRLSSKEIMKDLRDESD